MLSPGNHLDLRLLGIIVFNALNDIERVETLYVGYGSECSFSEAQFKTEIS